jgi:hypothetical protein
VALITEKINMYLGKWISFENTTKLLGLITSICGTFFMMGNFMLELYISVASGDAILWPSYFPSLQKHGTLYL